MKRFVRLAHFKTAVNLCITLASGFALSGCPAKGDAVASGSSATSLPGPAPSVTSVTSVTSAQAVADPAAPVVQVTKPSATAVAQGAATLFKVTGVAANDTLNVREKPDARSAKVATLAPGASQVRGTGRTESANGARWVEVTVGNVNGWANAVFLTADAIAPASQVGAEPRASADVPATSAAPVVPSAPAAAKPETDLAKCAWSFGALPTESLLDATGDVVITRAGKPTISLVLGKSPVNEFQSPACGRASNGQALIALQFDDPEFVTRVWFRTRSDGQMSGETKALSNISSFFEFKRQHKQFVTNDLHLDAWTKWSMVVKPTPVRAGPVEIDFSGETLGVEGELKEPVSVRVKLRATVREQAFKF